MSNALRKIRRTPENLYIIAMQRVANKKAKVFLYKGNEADHAICQFHISGIGAELAKKLDKSIVGDMGTKAELKRLGRTDLPCEVCHYES